MQDTQSLLDHEGRKGLLLLCVTLRCWLPKRKFLWGLRQFKSFSCKLVIVTCLRRTVSHLSVTQSHLNFWSVALSS